MVSNIKSDGGTRKQWTRELLKKRKKIKICFFDIIFFLVDQEFWNLCFEIQHFLILNKCKFLQFLVYGELCKARNTWLTLPGHGTLIHIHTELYCATFNCCELVGWGWALKTKTYSFYTLVDTGHTISIVLECLLCQQITCLIVYVKVTHRIL